MYIPFYVVFFFVWVPPPKNIILLYIVYVEPLTLQKGFGISAAGSARTPRALPHVHVKLPLLAGKDYTGINRCNGIPDTEEARGYYT